MTAQKNVSRMEVEKRKIELELDEIKEKMGKLVEEKEQLFTAVLLDGDGLIFDDSLMKQGAIGGRDAAKILLSSLNSLITHKLPEQAANASKILNKVVINMFINKTGLANILVKTGVVPDHATFHAFFAGLSQSHDLINVIDVGNGKEASDAKMRENLKLYASNAQCGFILLGASHDNGYAPVLSSLQTEGRLKNVLILKGYSNVAFELQQYEKLTVEIPGLFRKNKVQDVGISGFGYSTPKAGGGGKTGIVSGSTKKALSSSSKTKVPDFTFASSALSLSSSSLSSSPKGYYNANRNGSVSEGSTGMETDDGESDHMMTKDVETARMISRMLLEDDEEESDEDVADLLRALRVEAEATVAATVAATAAPKKFNNNNNNNNAASSSSTTTTPIGKKIKSNKPTTMKDYTIQMKHDESKGWIGIKTPKASKDKERMFQPEVGGGGGSGGGTADEIFGNSIQYKRTIKVDGGENAVRTLNPRPCHKEYLTDEGCKQASCAFGHNYELTKAQYALLKKLVHDMPCPFYKMDRCGAGVDCIYGHSCPHGDDCKWQPNCRYNELPGGGHAK